MNTKIAVDSGQTLRVALLGCGRIARLAHVAVLSRLPGVQLVGIADSQPHFRAFASHSAPGAMLFDDFQALLDETKPDAVVIALPTLAHCEAAVAALAAGAHVYLEKPIAPSLDEAMEIHRAWQATTLVGRIGFNARFGRLYRELKDALSRGTIGIPIAARSAFTARFPVESTWRLSPATGGGALLELASHHVDLMRFVFDSEIVSVRADTWSNRGNDESAMVELSLSNGVHTQTFVSHGSLEEDRFEVYGTEGKLSVDRYDSLVVERSGPLAKGGLSSAVSRLQAEVGALAYGMRKRRSPGQEPSFGESLEDFVTAARARKPTKPDLTDGLRALEAVEAARRSAFERQTVDMA